MMVECTIYQGISPFISDYKKISKEISIVPEYTGCILQTPVITNNKHRGTLQIYTLQLQLSKSV